ncbi:hypothetical protein BgiBS90_000447 [Biomphalaria glabrata]|nr:hypothetical protein BgiBS90_000447 [Biomphalaria glabrata]
MRTSVTERERERERDAERGLDKSRQLRELEDLLTQFAMDKGRRNVYQNYLGIPDNLFQAAYSGQPIPGTENSGSLFPCTCIPGNLLQATYSRQTIQAFFPCLYILGNLLATNASRNNQKNEQLSFPTNPSSSVLFTMPT